MNEIQNEIVSALDITKGSSFLDIGCGDGWACKYALEQKASRIVGIDLVRNPRLVVPSKGWEYVTCDIFSDKFLMLGRFDKVLCSGVLYHVEDPFRMIRRVAQVVETGGTTIIESVILDHPSKGMHFFGKDDPLNKDWTNYWAPSKGCFMEMCVLAGLAPTKFEYTKHRGYEAGGTKFKRGYVQALKVEHNPLATQRSLPGYNGAWSNQPGLKIQDQGGSNVPAESDSPARRQDSLSND